MVSTKMIDTTRFFAMISFSLNFMIWKFEILADGLAWRAGALAPMSLRPALSGGLPFSGCSGSSLPLRIGQSGCLRLLCPIFLCQTVPLASPPFLKWIMLFFVQRKKALRLDAKLRVTNYRSEKRPPCSWLPPRLGRPFSFAPLAFARFAFTVLLLADYNVP